MHMTTISLGDIPARYNRNEKTVRAYFVLLQAGFAPMLLLLITRVRSYRTFSPLPFLGAVFFCGTFHELALPLISKVLFSFWSPDFPLTHLVKTVSDCLDCLKLTYISKEFVHL